MVGLWTWILNTWNIGDDIEVPAARYCGNVASWHGSILQRGRRRIYGHHVKDARAQMGFMINCRHYCPHARTSTTERSGSSSDVSESSSSGGTTSLESLLKRVFDIVKGAFSVVSRCPLPS